MKIAWQDVEDTLPHLQETEGGYTSAQRGVITLPDDSKAFVKIGTDNATKMWVHKEIVAYTFLKEKSYPFIPELLSYSADRTALAIEALTSDQGWSWNDSWDENRLSKTPGAMDVLASISLSETEKALFGQGMVSPGMDGWKQLAASAEKQKALVEYLQASGHEDLAKNMDILALAKEAGDFTVEANTLVHNDVRADNCAWNPKLQAVRLVDWNWLQVSDRRIDTNALLVHVYGCGFEIPEAYRDYLDDGALLWLAGIWFNGVTSSNTSEKSALRDYQLASGVRALQLRK